MPSTRKNDPRYTLTTPLTVLDRHVALLMATVTANKEEVARRLGIHRSFVWNSWYRPAVQAYIAELIAQREQMVLEQSAAMIVAEQHEDYMARKQQKEALRARQHQPRLITQDQRDAASARLTAYHAKRRAERQHNTENG